MCIRDSIYEENTADLEQQRSLASKINITFREGFPKDSKLLTNGGLFKTPLSDKAHRLLVLDDVFGVAIADKNMARFASTYAHHHKVSSSTVIASYIHCSHFRLQVLIILCGYNVSDKYGDHCARCVRSDRTHQYLCGDAFAKLRIFGNISRHTILSSNKAIGSHVLRWKC